MTALIPLDEVFHFDVITSSPTTGAATDADSIPTFAVYEESTDTDIGVGGNMTKRTSLTGNYRASFTMSAANGFEVGKFYSVIASATVGAVAGKAVAAHIRCIAAEAIAGKQKVDVDGFGGVAGTFSSGRPEVNTSHVAGNTTAATILSRIYGGAAVTGTADSGTTTTMVDAGLTQADTDYWNGAWVIFTSGNISGQCRRITAFDPATDTITFTPAVTQAVSTQNFVILPSVDIPAAVWDVISADHQTQDTFGQTIGNSDGSTTSMYDLISDANILATATNSAVAALPTAAQNADAVWDEDSTAHQNAGTFGFEVGDPADWGDTSIRDTLDAIQTSMPNAGAIAAGIMAEIVEGAISVGDSFRLWNAALGGKASGLGTTTAVFRDLGDTKNRISATVDVDGNRSAVTLDLT